MIDKDIEVLIQLFDNQKKAFSGFMNNVIDFFQTDNDRLRSKDGRFVVHSLKHRRKDVGHLREKIKRKSAEGRDINRNNIFQNITDFCGVRVMHIRLTDFSIIHSAIGKHVEAQHWCYAEPPKAYTWDPEYKGYFESLGVGTEINKR